MPTPGLVTPRPLDDPPGRAASSPGLAAAIERTGLVAALACIAWLLATLPLLLGGVLRPLPAVALFVILFVPLLLIARPVLGTAALAGREPGPLRWPYGAIALIALASTVLNGLLHAEHLVLRRDAGSYAQIALWLAGHGELPIPVQVAAFGGPDPALDPSSPAFYLAGPDALQPQFMSGWPLLLVAGAWLAGTTGVLLLPALMGGLSLLVLGALAARLVGPRWAPLSVLALAVAQPFWHASRSTYSEPLAQLLLLAGLLLLVRALDEHCRPAAALAGLAFGVATLVRADALRELTLTVPLVGALVLARRREALPLAAGLLTGLAAGVTDGVVVARQYLRDISGSLLPLLILLAATLVFTGAVTLVFRRRPRPAPPAPFVGTLAGAATAVAFGLLAVRPWLHQPRGQPPAGAETIARLQAEQGLVVDGQRTYAEWALHWLAWWVGWPLLLLAAAGAAVLVARAVRGAERAAWGAVLAVLLGSTALTLWRPGITPDHPWADRRFVVAVLPAVALLGTWAAARAVTWLAASSVRRWVPAAAPLLAILLMAPAAAASAPLYDDRTEVGQRGAIERVCDALPADAAVLLVDQRAAREWPAAIRTSCAVPASGVKDSAPRTLERLAAKVSAAGRAPVLLAADSPIAITAAGLTPHQVVDLRMTEDARLLTRRPTRTVPLRVAVWLAFPDRCLPDRCRDGSPASVRSGDAATPAQARSAAGSLLPAGRER